APAPCSSVDAISCLEVSHCGVTQRSNCDHTRCNWPLRSSKTAVCMARLTWSCHGVATVMTAYCPSGLIAPASYSVCGVETNNSVYSPVPKSKRYTTEG